MLIYMYVYIIIYNYIYNYIYINNICIYVIIYIYELPSKSFISSVVAIIGYHFFGGATCAAPGKLDSAAVVGRSHIRSPRTSEECIPRPGLSGLMMIINGHMGKWPL